MVIISVRLAVRKSFTRMFFHITHLPPESWGMWSTPTPTTFLLSVPIHEGRRHNASSPWVLSGHVQLLFLCGHHQVNQTHWCQHFSPSCLHQNICPVSHTWETKFFQKTTKITCEQDFRSNSTFCSIFFIQTFFLSFHLRACHFWLSCLWG